MTPRLAALLERYAGDPGARKEVLAARAAEMPLEDRLEAAGRLMRLGDPRAAALWLFAARREHPESANAAYRLANALRLCGRTRAAAGILESLTRDHPAWGEPAQSLAWLHRRAGRPESAASVIERWSAAAGHRRRTLRAAVAFLREMGLEARAEAMLAGVEGVQGNAVLLAERGELLLRLGRFDEAESVLRDAVALAPGAPASCVRLAYVRRWERVEESPLDLVSAQLGRADVSAADRAALLFAIAKINDDLGRYADAFAAAGKGNAIRAAGTRFDRAAWSDFEQGLRDTFTPEFLERAGPGGASEENPVFIVGMPRSGTTLLEQRLSRHPALTAGGELELVESLARELAGNEGYPRGLAGLAPDAFPAAAKRWRRRLPPMLADAPRIVDKNPMNFLNIGLVFLLFPGARVIHCNRDPLDTALSIYLQNFSHPKNDYAYRPSDIAWMMALQRRVTAFWLHLFPRRIRTVRYESLAADPERTLRRALRYLGLDWDPACLEAAGEGAIATASVWQARQPVYRRSVGRAAHYAPWLGELRDALERAGISRSGSGRRASP